MSSPHDKRYVFKNPGSIKEARERMRLLEVEIMNIDRQLGDKDRTDSRGRKLSPQEYRKWRNAAKSSRIFKHAEHTFLKDWVKQRRLTIDAENLELRGPDDIFGMLVKAHNIFQSLLFEAKRNESEEFRTRLKELLSDLDVGRVDSVVEQYLRHRG